MDGWCFLESTNEETQAANLGFEVRGNESHHYISLFRNISELFAGCGTFASGNLYLHLA